MPSIPAPDPADEAAALSSNHLAGETAAVPLPPPSLGGWMSHAADEYSAAVTRLHRTLQAAVEAFRSAGGVA